MTIDVRPYSSLVTGFSRGPCSAYYWPEERGWYRYSASTGTGVFPASTYSVARLGSSLITGNDWQAMSTVSDI